MLLESIRTVYVCNVPMEVKIEYFHSTIIIVISISREYKKHNNYLVILYIEQDIKKIHTHWIQ